ncbi:MAG: DUF4382 domain-containing protein [Lentimicrobiaceae bacterium]|jgi:hypothetical protein
MNSIEIKNKKSAMLKGILYAVFFISVIALLPACKKDNNDKAHLSIRMTDAPANYDAVMVDVQGVEVMGDGGNLVMLNTNAGIYNLLDFTNGMDTLIASADLNAGSISQIRLILGTENSVMVDGVVYHLSTPSAEQSGLKLQIHQTFVAGVSYNILLDFDANQSVVLQGNGEYKLKPVIRTINAAISGSIKGSISPISLGTTVTATSNGVVYSTVANLNGYFMIAGLPAGTYDITVTPALPLLPVTITGKTVVIGAATDLGIIIF